MWRQWYIVINAVEGARDFYISNTINSLIHFTL